jgi:hypothetical protein
MNLTIVVGTPLEKDEEPVGALARKVVLEQNGYEYAQSGHGVEL